MRIFFLILFFLNIIFKSSELAIFYENGPFKINENLIFQRIPILGIKNLIIIY